MAFEKAPILLASASRSRLEILRGAGLETMRARPSGLDEEALREKSGGDAVQASLALAREKARLVSAKEPKSFVIGADQILVHQGRLYGKAETMDEARARLRLFRGSRHFLKGGAALMREGRLLWSASSSAEMIMRDFSDRFLEIYLESAGDAILQSVGCYALEGLGAHLFSQIEGDYFAILGIPLLSLLEALRREGAIEA